MNIYEVKKRSSINEHLLITNINNSRSVPCWNLLQIRAHRMQNNIPTLYILELDSSAVKGVKLSTIFCRFVPKRSLYHIGGFH